MQRTSNSSGLPDELLFSFNLFNNVFNVSSFVASLPLIFTSENTMDSFTDGFKALIKMIISHISGFEFISLIPKNSYSMKTNKRLGLL